MKSLDTVRLRKAIGWLGFSLAIIVLLLCVVFDCVPGDHIFPDSISATYYYAPTITPFMIILGAASILLISYMGYDKQDDIICTLAGIFGLLICLFPCQTINLIPHWATANIPTVVGTFQIPQNISSIVHNISAIIFFGLLAYNSFFLFTKSKGKFSILSKRQPDLRRFYAAYV